MFYKIVFIFEAFVHFCGRFYFDKYISRLQILELKKENEKKADINIH